MLNKIIKLCEKFVGYVEYSSMGTEELTPVHLNPSKGELAKLLKKYGFLRVLVAEDGLSNIYVWDGNGAYHEEVGSEFDNSEYYYPGTITINNGDLLWEVDIHSEMGDEKGYFEENKELFRNAPIVNKYGIAKIYVTPSILLDIRSSNVK